MTKHLTNLSMLLMRVLLRGAVRDSLVDDSFIHERLSQTLYSVRTTPERS
jgi:hypothetical protein